MASVHWWLVSITAKWPARTADADKQICAEQIGLWRRVRRSAVQVAQYFVTWSYVKQSLGYSLFSSRLAQGSHQICNPATLVNPAVRSTTRPRHAITYARPDPQFDTLDEQAPAPWQPNFDRTHMQHET